MYFKCLPINIIIVCGGGVDPKDGLIHYIIKTYLWLSVGNLATTHYSMNWTYQPRRKQTSVLKNTTRIMYFIQGSSLWISFVHMMMTKHQGNRLHQHVLQLQAPKSCVS